MEDNISILIIEDEALIAENIRQLLEDFGYEISGVCYNYASSLLAIEKSDYDLVITDINLGDGIDEKSGLTLVSHLKSIKNCPFVFLTAFSDKETIKKAALLSPSAYLVKPVNASNLYAAVQLAVENFNNAKTAPEGSPSGKDRPDYFFIKLGNKLIKIFWKDVYHLEAIKNYVRIKTPEYSSGLLIRGSLQQVMNTMMPERSRNLFIKITRATAIAKDIIKQISENAVETDYGTFERSADIKKEI